jgi:hypothetical protein
MKMLCLLIVSWILRCPDGSSSRVTDPLCGCLSCRDGEEAEGGVQADTRGDYGVDTPEEEEVAKGCPHNERDAERRQPGAAVHAR